MAGKWGLLDGFGSQCEGGFTCGDAPGKEGTPNVLALPLAGSSPPPRRNPQPPRPRCLPQQPRTRTPTPPGSDFCQGLSPPP